MSIKDFLEHHYRHFNAAVVIDAAKAYAAHLDGGGQMLMTLAGAMSTAELGLSLAEMIRQGKVHAISCTGANLEEDVFNLVAHDHYVRVPNYRDLSPQDERDLLARHLNRVTDTCIPEEEAMRRMEREVLDLWSDAYKKKERYFPHEYMFRLIREGRLEKYYQIDPKDSWLVAAAERNLPMFVPGWEDSTLGNIFVGHCLSGDTTFNVVKSGPEYMAELAVWYLKTTTGRDVLAEIATKKPGATQKGSDIGFFQIGGGIAGDFPICVVPMIHQDLQIDCPFWGYFCQISDSTTSYGSYSGAVPNEKITWGKLDIDTPKFIIESDASIVAPLLFAHILGW